VNPPPSHRPRHHHIPASRLLAFVDRARLDALLARLLPDPTERELVGRILVEDGPLHHRGVNFVLLALIDRLLERLPGTDARAEGRKVPMRLPPHLRDRVDDGHYPLELPTRALEKLAGGDAQAVEAMVDCLTDGPPHHALGNVAMVALLERALSRLDRSE